MAIVKDLGMVTAYAYAVAGGYEGTEAEFTELLGQAGVTLEQLENLSAVAATLAPGSEATASYSDGVLTFGIPQGATGETGQTGPQGPEGPTGNGIVSITKTGTSGLVDTYTITFTDGTTTTFTVTNGADGDITNVAEAFDSAKAYSVGDMVLYQGTLYAFTSAHPAGTWVGSDAEAVILSDEVAGLKTAIIPNDFRYMLSDCLKKMLWTVQDGAGLVDAIENSLGITTVDIGSPYVFTTFDGEYIDKNNGGVLTDNTWCRTNYIPCKNAASIEFNGNGDTFTTARYGAFYTKNMEFISNIHVTLDGTTTSVSVTVPDNAEVFCISFAIPQKTRLLSIIPR